MKDAFHICLHYLEILLCWLRLQLQKLIICIFIQQFPCLQFTFSSMICFYSNLKMYLICTVLDSCDCFCFWLIPAYLCSRSSLISTPNAGPTEFRLSISEHNFIRNDTRQRATFPDLLLLLFNVTEILIPANYDMVRDANLSFKLAVTFASVTV